MNTKKTILTVIIVILVLSLAQGCTPAARKTAPGKIDNYLQQIESAVNEESWSKASRTWAEVDKRWKSVKPRYQLNYRTDDIGQFEISLARLKVFIEQKEKAQALAELKSTQKEWQDINGI